MTFEKTAFVYFVIFVVSISHISAWTIDLPEVRKILFERNEKHKDLKKDSHDDYLREDQKFYSNIEGNSKHHAEDYEHVHHSYDKENYAEEYGYHTYMEKKVHAVVRDGSYYLEGLRRSLEDYNELLESCNRRNGTRQNSSSRNSTWSPAYDPPNNSSLPSGSQPPVLNFQNYDNSTVPLKPNSSDFSSLGIRPGRRNMSCDEATEASEQIRRFADLALWATGRLQDLAYAKKYQKTDEQEENELILKLAWFLDRLAYLSGYEPDFKKHYESRTTKSTPTLPPVPPTLVPSSDDMNKEMMDCLRRKSSEPATVRCRYPMEIPDMMQQIINQGTSPSPPSSDAVVPMSGTPENVAGPSEILITADSSIPLPQRSISKRSTEYAYYYPPKPLHEVTYPVPLVKLIKHRLSNIKSVVKSIVERRLAHIAEKKEEKQHFEKHFDKRSIDDKFEMSNSINPLSVLPKPVVKSIEKRPLDTTLLLHYPVSDVSVINTKSFKKRSIDDRSVTSNHINQMSNWKLFDKYVKKGSQFRKKFENLLPSIKTTKRLSKYPDTKLKSIHKRFTEDPYLKLANYYIKYKVWDNSNPITSKNYDEKKPANYDVKNHLTVPKSVQKRSLFKKKVVHMHIPKPLQVVHTYINSLGKSHTKPKLLTQLHKLREITHKKHDKLHKIIKRSLKYEHMYLPRIPMDPQGDISYYVKNKEGTNFNPDPVQAAQVRLGLEQVFQTGNIEVVRRFGSNYNPLNPAPFYAGVIATMTDA
uniref:SFRICE_005224 n=1 Tax=Spodoptera frugiperda TaxID=7108 RepID=A0A2H1VID9_SPOFR